MIKPSMTEHTRTFTESLRFILEGFTQQSLDDQQEFLEYFGRIIRLTGDRRRKKLLVKFNSLLEKEMNKKFDEWLESEMKG